MSSNALVDGLVGQEVASIVADGVEEKKPGKVVAWLQKKFTWMPCNKREWKVFGAAWGISGIQSYATAGVAMVAWNWVVNLIPLGLVLFCKGFLTKFLAMMSVIGSALWKVA